MLATMPSGCVRAARIKPRLAASRRASECVRDGRLRVKAKDASAVDEPRVEDPSTSAVDVAPPSAVDQPAGAGTVASQVASEDPSRVTVDVSPASTPDASETPEAHSSPSTDDRFESVKKVLVVGASGGVGRKVVEALVAKGVEVVALVRSPEKAARMLPAAAQIVKGDVYQFATLPGAAKGCDAVICATGATDVRDPLGPFSTDYMGTKNLIAATQQAGIEKFVFVTSIGTDDPLYNPLNLFWGVLFWKKRAEEELQRSGLKYTIVRPGGLVTDGKQQTRNGKRRGEGSVVMAAAGTYGVPPRRQAGSILRSKVAECCVEALVQPAAECKVVEIISEPAAPALAWDVLFDGVM